MMCWIALDRAVRLAETRRLPGDRLARWREAACSIHDFVERRCWSDELSSYVRSAESAELDASVLLAALMEFPSDRDPRMSSTIDAVRKALGDGALLYRYQAEDGLGGGEGAFLCCSFWLADALARAGRIDEAADLMGELVGLGNDVGLYAEEVDRENHEFLGNFPQGLVHLALVNAAVSITRAQRT
jgi:GH15 family glucan-1,4-alpha-glucosidase